MRTKYKMLFVEDNADTVRVIMCLMDNHIGPCDFVVDSAPSIAGCLEALAAKSYDILLLDLNLKNGKGEETFLKIYNACNRNIGLPNEDRTPIIVLTGDVSVDYTEIVMKGAMDFILKPITGGADDLCRRLHMAILRFPYKRSQELHESIERQIKETKEFLSNS